MSFSGLFSSSIEGTKTIDDFAFQSNIRYRCCDSYKFEYQRFLLPFLFDDFFFDEDFFFEDFPLLNLRSL